MATIERILTTFDGRRLVTFDGLYIATGQVVEARAPAAPSGITYNRATGLLSWDAVVGASLYYIYEAQALHGTRTLLGTTTATSIQTTVLGDEEYRTWVVRAEDDHSGILGPASKPAHAADTNRKLV